MSLKKKDNWINVLDEQTGLVGWVLEEDFSSSKPEQKIQIKDYRKSFDNFKSRVLEMSRSIKEAISVDTFLEVEHLGGAAALIIADDSWFKGRRHANQAFQVYELWRNEKSIPIFSLIQKFKK